jgi:hypothetical protein
MAQVNFSSLKEIKVSGHLIRFLFGGACTVLAGLIAKQFGPTVGGLFLAFPAIFPAGVTLIERHEERRKSRMGFDGKNRGRIAASMDAAGAALGYIALMGFAFVLWILLPNHDAFIVVGAATFTWVLLAYGLWQVRKGKYKFRRGRYG